MVMHSRKNYRACGNSHTLSEPILVVSQQYRELDRHSLVREPMCVSPCLRNRGYRRNLLDGRVVLEHQPAAPGYLMHSIPAEP